MNNAEEKLKVLILKYVNCQLSKLEKADTLEKAVELLKQFDEGKVISQRGKELAFAEFEKKLFEQLSKLNANEDVLRPVLEAFQTVKVESGLIQPRIPVQRPPPPRIPSMPFPSNPAPNMVNAGVQQMLINFGVLWQQHQMVQRQLSEANTMIQRFNHLVSHVSNQSRMAESISKQKKVALNPIQKFKSPVLSKEPSISPSRNEVRLVDTVDTTSMDTPRPPPRPYKRKNFETSIQDSSTSSDSGIFDPTPKKVPAIQRDVEPVLRFNLNDLLS